MGNEYKRLNEELEGADLDSLLPGFDREASWNELSPRLKKVQKKRTYWLGYAAALAVILVVAWTIRMQLNKTEVTENVAKVTPAQPAPETEAVTGKPAVVAPVSPKENIAPQPAIARKTKPQTTKRIEEAKPTEELIANNPQQPAETTEEPKQIVEPVITQTPPVIKRPKAVHLLDIDNENRAAAIQNHRELQGLPQRIVNLIPGRPYSNIESDRKPSSLFSTN